MAYVKNMYLDEWCRESVEKPEKELQNGNYYGWISHENASFCVKSGVFDNGKFCMTYPLQLSEHKIELSDEKITCLPSAVQTTTDLAHAITEYNNTSDVPSLINVEKLPGIETLPLFSNNDQNIKTFKASPKEKLVEEPFETENTRLQDL